MIERKNRFIFQISLGAILLSLVSHFVNRYTDILSAHAGHSSGMSGPQYSNQFGMMLNILLAIPIVLYIVSFLLYRARADHPVVPYLNTGVLTFSSISIIAGGGGNVELHFSIFMVVAMLAYYERIALVLVMTVLFAVQHFAGYLFSPEIVFGASDYSFQMVVVHALFLILTAGATILQIRSSTKIRRDMEAEKREERQKVVGDIVQRLSAASREIVQTAGDLSTSAAHTLESSTQIAGSMQQIAAGTQSQVHGASESMRAMEEIAQGVSRIAVSSSEVSETAGQSAGRAADGNEAAGRMAQQMELIESSVAHTDAAVKSLYDRSQEIDQMLEMIQNVAYQTNLLALNAGIEASRAGEHGRGFAVVATEIRKLAEQSSTTGEQIAELVAKMQHDSTGSVNAMQQVKDEVQSGLSIILSARESFEQLLDLSRQVADRVSDISSTAQQMSAGSEQVAASIHDMSNIAGGNEAISQEVSAKFQEQLSHMDQIREASASLHRSSQDLESIMNKVKEE